MCSMMSAECLACQTCQTSQALQFLNRGAQLSVQIRRHCLQTAFVSLHPVIADVRTYLPVERPAAVCATSAGV